MTVLNIIPRFRAARASIQTLESREQWSRGDIEAFQLEKINLLWKLAKRNSAYYSRLANEKTLPEQFRSLSEFSATMPILDKSLVRSSPELFLSKKMQPGQWQRTGGSTGDPLRVYWSHQAHRRVLAAKYRFDAMHGVDFLERKAWLWGHHASFATGIRGRVERSKQRVSDMMRRRKRYSAYRLGAKDIEAHLIAISKFRPTSIYGYSSAVYLLAKQALQQGVNLESLRLCTFTAEPCPDFFLDTTRQAFNCAAAIEYGSVECGLMANSFPDNTLRIREDLVYLEHLEPEGGRYPILVTVLENDAFPLIRYRVEDVVSDPIVRPKHGFAILKHVVGRDNDVLISRRGELVHSMAIKHILEVDPRIRRFQVTQSREGDLSVLIESNSPARELNLERIHRSLSDFVDGYDVAISVTPQISGNLAGKHRWIQSFKFGHLRPQSSRNESSLPLRRSAGEPHVNELVN